MFSRKLSQLVMCALAATLLVTAIEVSVEAKSKKRKATSISSSKKSRSHSARRTVARRGRRHRVVREEAYRPDPSPAIVPDRIEVMEFGSNSSADLSRLLNLPQPSSNNSGTDVGTITPSRAVNIDAMRVIQIQQALASKGFYSGETSGNYDAATIDAMRRFQTSNKITATGYPTAHALKRLGLASW